MDDVKKDLILRELYYSPKTGFRSAPHLFELAVKEDKNITLKDVREWLKTQSTFTKYKTYNNPSFFRQTFVRYLGEQVQVDLIIIPERFVIDEFNHVFVAIEILSRYAFAYPLKSKSGKATLDQIKIFLSDFRKRFQKTKTLTEDDRWKIESEKLPKLMQFDEGREFLNKESKTFFESEDITYFFSHSNRKATIVERFNRTLKDKMIKLLDSGEKNWIKYFPDLVENYNTQEHRSIQMKPADVNIHNQYTVWGRLFGHIMNHVGEPKFKIGDKVRVLHFNPKGKELKKYFEEKYPTPINPKTGKKKNIHLISGKYKPPFSEEIFRITNVLMGDPIVYKLYSDEAKVDILGKFYEAELSLIK